MISVLGLIGFVVLAGLLSGFHANAAEPDLKPSDLPHFSAVEPARALGTFEVLPGFRLELAAHEPEVVDPIAVSFDAKGRAYVLEMRDYSERRPERLGRVRRLEDRDGDGRFETSVVFLENLPWPTAITCWDGGVFVGATPDILFARDDDGDGRADVRQLVFSGFASDFAPYETNKLNVQAMFNSFQWGLDCRIHGASGMTGGRVRRVDSDFTRAWRRRGGLPESVATKSSAEFDARGRDFSFDPRTLELRPETGGGQYGMTFDDFGRKFLCSNSDHLQYVQIDGRYAGRASGHSLPSSRVSIAADGPSAEVFRLSPEEPWRVIRTRWRVTGLVPGMVEGGGRSSGYFTSATGLTIYRGDAYGPGFSGDAFVADCGSNLIHHKKIVARGCELSGVRAPDEARREFIASRDTWFRPVQFVNAPDGCLWAIDMYREIIEHPWSLPPGIKKLLDLNSGSDRGRLYRIVPENQPIRRTAPDLSRLTDEALAALLSHPNAWHRDSASRLLVERGADHAASVVRKILAARAPTPRPLGFLHGLHLLDALGIVQEPDLAAALQHPSPEVRRHGIRIAESTYGDRDLPASLVPLLLPRPDEDPNVRAQLAFSLATLRHPRRAEILAELLRSARPEAGESLIADAVLASAGDSAPELFRLVSSSDTGAPPSNRAMADLAELIGRRNRAKDTALVLGRLAELPRTSATLGAVARLATGLRRAGSSLTVADPDHRLAPLETMAADLLGATAPPTSATIPALLDAIHVLGQRLTDPTRATLRHQLATNRPVELQRAAIEELLRGEAAAGTRAILDTWANLAPPARELAAETLLRRPPGVRAILDATRARRIAPRDLTTSQLGALRSHSNASIRQEVLELFGAPPASRLDAIASILPALDLRGDAERGRAIYQAQCATCHRLGGTGFALGPDLESIRSQPKEKLVVAIVDPNREVAPAYLATTVETTDHESQTGLAGAETAAGLVLRQANGVQQQIARERIRTVKAEGRSIMPEGFEATLNAQAMADLLALLTGQP